MEKKSKYKEIKLKILMKELESLRNDYYLKMEKIECIKLLIFEECDLNSPVEEEEIINEKVDEKVNENTDNKEENSKEVQNDKEQPINEEKIEEKIEEEIVNSEHPVDIKKIFRQIVLKTHPDRIKNKENKEELNKIYMEAIESFDSKNYINIIFLGYKLGIDLTTIDDKRFSEIEVYRENLRRSVHNLDYDSLMIWYNTSDQRLKDVMLKKILKQISLLKK